MTKRIETDPDRRRAAAFHDHGRKCKKSPFECGVCKAGIEWFKSLPLLKLSRVLREG